MNILYDLGLIAGVIYVNLVVLSFLIVVGSVMLLTYSSIYIFQIPGSFALALWLTKGRENIFKDKILRKIIKYITYAYMILTFLALLPLFIFYTPPKAFLVTLAGCAMGYIGIILDIIILYYLYIKLRKYYTTLRL
jgi:hypothetical protein